MTDIFDTRFEDKDVEISDNRSTLGDDINLLALDPTLKKVVIGVGWDLNAFDTDALDLDVSLFMIGKDGETREDEDFIFYNNPVILDGGIKHNGDSRTGAGDGDDESISIDLEAVPFDVFNLYFVISIYKGFEKQQTLSQVRNAYIRVVNEDNAQELSRYDISEVLVDRTEETAILAAALNREGPKWHFKPMDEVEAGGLGEFARRYGLIINQE